MKYLVAIILIFILIGCGGDTINNDNNVTDVTEIIVEEQDVQADFNNTTIDVESQIIEITILDSQTEAEAITLSLEGLDAYTWDVNSYGGTINVEFILYDNGGTADYVIRQSKYIDNIKYPYDIYIPSVFRVGNLILVDTLVNIPANDSNETEQKWGIDIEYFGESIERVGSFTIYQEIKNN